VWEQNEIFDLPFCEFFLVSRFSLGAQYSVISRYYFLFFSERCGEKALKIWNFRARFLETEIEKVHLITHRTARIHTHNNNKGFLFFSHKRHHL